MTPGFDPTHDSSRIQPSDPRTQLAPAQGGHAAFAASLSANHANKNGNPAGRLQCSRGAVHRLVLETLLLLKTLENLVSSPSVS